LLDRDTPPLTARQQGGEPLARSQWHASEIDLGDAGSSWLAQRPITGRFSGLLRNFVAPASGRAGAQFICPSGYAWATNGEGPTDNDVVLACLAQPTAPALHRARVGSKLR
jgi:hypothetical protein